MRTSYLRNIGFHSLALPAVLALLLLAGPAAVDAGANSTVSASKPNAARAISKADLLADQWGIEITGLRMAAHNHMVDFRFRVLDSTKADPLFVRHTKPYLVDQKTGKVLAVPNTAKIGPLRNSNKPKEGRIYWMFFGNHTGLISQGSQVSVVIGDFKAENLRVE
jgi:hypothetical protein